MEFTSKIFLPVLKKEIRYHHINNSNFLTILKFSINKDDEGLMNYFEWMIQNCLLDKELFYRLTNLEKFLIFLDLRSVLIGDKLQLNSKTGNKIDLLISSIKNNIVNKIKEIDLIKIVNYNNITVHLTLPKSLNINNIDDLYYEIIDKVQIDEDVIQFSELKSFEKDGIISSLPASLTEEMISFITICQNLSNDINIITGNEKLGLENIPLRVFDTSLFHFMKSLLGDDLMNFYELQYNMLNKIKLSNQHFMSITPNECKILMNLYNEDMKRQEEAQKGNSSIPSMPSMPSMPKFK